MKSIFFTFLVMSSLQMINDAPDRPDFTASEVYHLTLSEEMEIPAQGPGYLLAIPAAITSDNKGNIYIVDRGEYNIKKFDNRGHWQKTFGRKGEGPGELSGPLYAVCIDALGRIRIACSATFKLITFDSNAKFLNSVPLVRDDYFAESICRWGEGGVAVATYSRLTLIDRDGRFVKSILLDIAPPGPMLKIVPKILASTDEYVVLCHNERFLMDVFDMKGEKLASNLYKEFQNQPYSEDEVHGAKKELIKRLGNKDYPAIVNNMILMGGNILLKLNPRSNDGFKERIEIFDLKGSHLGTLIDPNYSVLNTGHFDGKGKFYSIVENKETGTAIKRYKLQLSK